jgi:hypothetical protein
MTIVEFHELSRLEVSNRAIAALITVMLLVLTLLAFPFGGVALAAVPTIQAQNPSVGGPGNIISDKGTNTEGTYHFVARVSDAGGLGPSHIEAVSVTVEDGDSDVTADVTLPMSRVDPTDAWEVFWTMGVTGTADTGAGRVTFTVVDSQGNVTTDTVAAQIDRSAETVEIDNPANGEDLRFFDTDADGRLQAPITGTVSLGMTAGEDRVDLFYSTSTASQEPVWTSCGPAAAIAADRTFSGECELAVGVTGEQVTMVAARAVNFLSCVVPMPPPECIASPGLTAARPQSGDAHRVQGITQEPSVDATPEEDTNMVGTSHTVLTEVTDQDGVPIVSATVTVEYSGANDRDDSFSTASADDRCRTKSDGTCRVVMGPDPSAQGDESPAVTETTTETGLTTATVWVGTAPDAGESPSAEDSDATDVVLKNWVESASPPAASSVLYIPEGATTSRFTTFVLISNPNDFDVTADVTFLTQNGAEKPDSVQGLEIGAGQRRTIDVNTALGLGFDVATKIEASAPVVAEGAMHFGGSRANSDMIATPLTSRRWFQPEGVTHSGFATFIQIANPDEDTDTTVRVTFLTNGTEISGPSNFGVPAGSRRTVDVRQECGCNADVSTLIEVVGGGPEVVTARSLHKIGDVSKDIAIGASIGTVSTADTWVVPEGATHSDWHTFILISNPNETASTVNVKFLRTGQEQSPDALQGFVVPARSRRTIDVNLECNCADDVSTVVDSVQGTVAVEGTIQKEDGTGFVIADSLGSPGDDLNDALGERWASAEGATHSGFTTFILLSNPTATDASVDLSFIRSDGVSVGESNVQIPPFSRLTVDVRLACFAADAVEDAGCFSDIWTLANSQSGFVMELAIDWASPGVGFSKGRSLSSRLLPFS